MKKIRPLTTGGRWILCILCDAFGEELQPIQLPKPQLDGGKPLMQVLKDRKSSRASSSEKLPLQVLSNLPWEASGINRSDAGNRTAPSAANWQEINICVAMGEGLSLKIDDGKGEIYGNHKNYALP